MTGSTKVRTLGVVLAGGASRRFGRDKTAAMLGGETLLMRAVRRAAPQVDRVVVSGCAASTKDIIAIPDETPGQGPLAGVLAGLAWADEHGFDRVATFPCDVPFFPSNLSEHLSKALAGGADYVIVQRGTQKHPVFALWRTDCRETLEKAFANGLRGLHAVDQILECAIVQFETSQGVPELDPFFNINAIEDFETAERLLERLGE